MGYDTRLDPGMLEDLTSKFPDAWTIFKVSACLGGHAWARVLGRACLDVCA